MKKNINNQKNGFALLFTVLVITLILTITVGISSTTFKQGILSGLARDSQIAFYQTDRMLECALLFHTDSSDGLYAHSTFRCGSTRYQQRVLDGGVLYYTDESNRNGGNEPCAVVRVIPKNITDLDGTASLQVSGYNICQVHPRQVERTLLVTF